MKTPEIETAYMPHGHRLQCVILAERGFVTADALAWLARDDIAVLVVHEGEFLAVVNAAGGRLARGELAMRRRQMECVLNPKRRLAAARELVMAKIGMLGLDPGIGLIGKAAKVQSIEDAMVIEAEAGAIYRRSWKGQELVFKDGTKTVFDARARSWRTGRLGETEAVNSRTDLRCIRSMPCSITPERSSWRNVHGLVPDLDLIRRSACCIRHGPAWWRWRGMFLCCYARGRRRKCLHSSRRESLRRASSRSSGAEAAYEV